MRFLRKPLLLHYFVTTACNCRCSFCNIPQSEQVMTANIKDIALNLPAARKLGCRFVDFTGGEPLLFPDLPEALRLAKKAGYITSVTTNGLLLKPRAKELKGLIALPRMSLDGGRDIHDKIRGVRCFDAAIDGLEEAHRHGIKPDIIFTLTNHNKDQIELVYRIAQSFGVILILDPAFSYFGNDSALELDPILKKWSWRRGVYVNKAFLAFRKQGGNHTQTPRCRAGEATIVVSPDNQLLLPCFHGKQWNYPIIGNLESLWKSPEVLISRAQAGKLGVCEGCTINCYMDPSFHFAVDGLLVRSLISKFRYTIEKWLLPP